MNIKLILCDFDGTITQTDVLDTICDLVGRKPESVRINRLFQAGQKDRKQALRERFSLLAGLPLERTYPLMENILLTEGAEELFACAAQLGIHVLVLSGNAQFVLEFFARKLQFTRVCGSRIWVENGIIQPWNQEKCLEIDKYREAVTYIEQHGLEKNQIIAIGDSVADEEIFALAGKSFVINPKGNVQADMQIQSLEEVIPYLKEE